MATYTTNLNLKKPDGPEAPLIADINNNMDEIDTAYGNLNTKTNTQTVSGVTATMLNCTANLTTNLVRVRSLLGGQMLHIKVTLRGDITAVTGTEYSQIKISGLPSLSGFTLSDAICTMREHEKCFYLDVDTLLVSNFPNDSNSLLIQHQRPGGTAVNLWKTCTGFYVDCNVLLIK